MSEPVKRNTPNISDIRKRLAISLAMEAAFNDGEPNWYANDIKTLLDLFDRVKEVIEVTACSIEVATKIGASKSEGLVRVHGLLCRILKELEEGK